MWIFQVFVKTAAGQHLQGLVLAESRPRAVELAVERTKDQYGAGSRVKFIVPLVDAGDINRIQHAGFHKLLCDLDQIRWVSWHLHKNIRRMAERIKRAIELVKETQELQRRRNSD